MLLFVSFTKPSWLVVVFVKDLKADPEAQLPTLGDLRELRKDKNNAYTWFLSNFGAILCGRKTWKDYFSIKEVSAFMTPSDEALGLLIMHNSYHYWTGQHEDIVQRIWVPKKGKKYCQANPSNRPRYTHDKTQKRRLGGWSKEGIQLYNQLLKEVVEDRKINQSFETTFLQAFQATEADDSENPEDSYSQNTGLGIIADVDWSTDNETEEFQVTAQAAV